MTTISGSSGSDILSGTSGADSISGGGGNDIILAGSGNDSIDGGGGNDVILAGSGNDVVSGGAGNDFIDGGSGTDVILGGSGNDIIDGGSGNDVIDGGSDNDVISGGSGNDVISGGSGNDVLIGVEGADWMAGGAGNDVFVYLDALDSTTGSWDRILDLAQGRDKIDLSALLGPDKDLAWGGKTAIADGAWYQNAGSSTLVFADINGDSVADFKIELRNASGLKLTVSDFIGVSNPPVAIDDTATTNEDHGNVFAVLANDLAPANDGHDGSDHFEYRVDGGNLDKIYLVSFDQHSAHGGTVRRDDNGTPGDQSDDKLVYDPHGQFEYLAVGETATDTFTYMISDDHGGTDMATVTVNVTGVNDAPVAQAIAQDANEDTGNPVSLTADFSDVDTHDTHTFSIDTSGTVGHVTNNNDGTFSYDAHGQFEYLAAGENATDTFSYTVTDNHGASSTRTATVTIQGENDAPVITSAPQSGAVSEGDDNSSMTAKGQVRFSDVDASDSHAFSVSSAATHGSASVDGSGKWTYTVSDTDAVDALAAGEQLSDSFTVKVDDGHDGTATQVVNIDITGTNDDPFITSAAQSGIVSEGDPLHGANMSATGQVTFSDVDLSDTHTLSVSSNPAYGTASVNDAGNWSYTVADAGAVDALAVGQHLTDHFRVQVDDHHGGFATQAVSIDILGTNDAPVITSGGGGGSANVSVPENSTNVTNVDADDPDTGALLTYQILQTLGTDFAAFEIDSSSGVLKFAPDFEKTPGNTYVVDVQVTDDAGATDTQSIAVTVTGSHAVIANDDIVLTNLPQGADILIPASALLANDTGAPSFPLHVESAANAENNDVVSLSSGDVTYVDNAPLNGSFDYTASDGQVESAFAHVTVVTQTQVGVVQGTAESEILIAGGDDDFLQGFEGNDFLSGGAGNDRLLGDAGCDTLVGGAGDDFLSGDGGSDTFDYNALSDAGTAGDLIFDFQQGTDHLDLRDLMSSIGAPHDNTAAFDNGYVRFTNGSGTALVEVDSNGGSDSFVTLATVVTDAPLTQADFIL